MQPAVRERLLARTRGILQQNYTVLEDWLRGFGDTFSWIAPKAGAICFTRYRAAIPGEDLVERVRASENTLLVPGEHFGMPGYLRFGYGNEADELRHALAAAASGLRKAFGD